jgi:CPA2 family monovalent cation:H+ antiporter-2
VIYGDATQQIFQEAAKLQEARLLIITTPSAVESTTIVSQAKKINKDLSIVARADDMDHMKALQGQGIYEVVQPEFEASLELTRQALIHLNIPMSKIYDFSDVCHRELYAPLYDSEHHYSTIAKLKSVSRGLELRWVNIPENSPADGHTLESLHVRKRTGLSVVAVIRDDRLQANPQPDYVLRSGDLVGVIGEASQMQDLKKMLNEPSKKES